MPKRWIAALLSVSLLFGTLSQATPVLLSVGGEENGLVVQAGTVRLNAGSGSYSFSGGVKILGDGFSLSAAQGRYDARTDQLSVSGSVRVRIEDESVISASALQYNGTSGAWQAEDFGMVSDSGERVAARAALFLPMVLPGSLKMSPTRLVKSALITLIPTGSCVQAAHALASTSSRSTWKRFSLSPATGCS